MVKRIQKIDEYYEDDEDDNSFIFYAPSYFETDEQLVIVACLMLLEQRYRVMESMTPAQVLDEIDVIMDSLSDELSDVVRNRALSHIQEYYLGVLENFAIPSTEYASMDRSMLEIMGDGVTNAIKQLVDELKVKSKFFDGNMSKDDFSILPNFKRAIQKIVDAVGNNLIYGKELSKRNVYKFVYGEDKLYRWITANDDKVCGWCRVQESLPPRLLSEMPLDHPRGRCVIEPIDYTYSDEYYLMLARGEYAEVIDAYGR